MIREFEDILTDRLDAELEVDLLWPSLTTMEAATARLLMEGWSRSEIAAHFEVTRQAVNDSVWRIRDKASAGRSGGYQMELSLER
ncbi:MAG TPA: hypothetical protein VJA25_09020 [Dehalococcoidia bacterium]|nr:hypothetical protein [Dehalococcoidia bacterium]